LKKILLAILSLAVIQHGVSQSFVKVVGEPYKNDGPTCFKQFENFAVLAGYSGNKSYLKKVSFEGEIEWTIFYDFTENINFISDLMLDGNFLVGCGYGHDSGGKVFTDFYFKLDLNSQEMQWVKTSSLKLKPNAVHKMEDGNYLFTGDEYVHHKFGIFLLTLQAKNGKKDKFTTWYFSGRESAGTSVLEGDILYVGGRYALQEKEDKYRGAITAFDVNTFSQIYSRYYLNSRTANARNYLSNLILDNDTLVAAFFTNNKNVSSEYTVSFAKIDKEGELLWAFEYELEGYTNLTVRDMKALPDGYLIYGFTRMPHENLFIIRLNKEGYVKWAKVYGEHYSDMILSDQGSFLFVKDDYVYFSGQSRNVSPARDYNTVIVKKSLDAEDGSCWQKPVSVVMKSYLELIEGEINLTRIDTLFKLGNASFKRTSQSASEPFFHCIDQIAQDDFVTLFYPATTIEIPVLNNDLIGGGLAESITIVKQPKHGSAVVKNDMVIYSVSEISSCARDSVRYKLKAHNGIESEAWVFIEKIFVSEDTVEVIQQSDTTGVPLYVKSDIANVVWQDGTRGNLYNATDTGFYYADINQRGCIYRQFFHVVENPYSFKSVAYNNITFVMDVSLSMNRADRLPLLKEALFKILRFMRPEDLFSVVTYAADAVVLFDGISAADFSNVEARVRPLTGAGQSNVNLVKSAALGYTVSSNNYREGTNNRIIFTTDGNISKAKQQELKTFLQKQKSADTYFTIFLFNVATVYQKQMQELADATGAALYVITPENIDAILLKEFKAVGK
jgi:hypothetical protein